MKKQLALDLLLSYVLDSEEQDFNENPTNGHVFYLAYYLKWGKRKADIMLQNTINDLEFEIFD